jgi:hypothetical protein
MGSTISRVATPPPEDKPAIQKGALRISQGLVAQIERDSAAQLPPSGGPPPPPAGLAAPTSWGLPPVAAVEEKRQERDALLRRLELRQREREEARLQELQMEARVTEHFDNVKADLAGIAPPQKPQQQLPVCKDATRALLACLEAKSPSHCASTLDAFDACVHAADLAKQAWQPGRL